MFVLTLPAIFVLTLASCKSPEAQSLNGFPSFSRSLFRATVIVSVFRPLVAFRTCSTGGPHWLHIVRIMDTPTTFLLPSCCCFSSLSLSRFAMSFLVPLPYCVAFVVLRARVMRIFLLSLAFLFLHTRLDYFTPPTLFFYFSQRVSILVVLSGTPKHVSPFFSLLLCVRVVRWGRSVSPHFWPQPHLTALSFCLPGLSSFFLLSLRK